ncbi:MAG TPA: hypothetical protein PK272_07680, partial [Methanoregulaceae archaeon]|nr:hypothetical protein [Methanoregulaceae archaeon]
MSCSQKSVPPPRSVMQMPGAALATETHSPCNRSSSPSATICTEGTFERAFHDSRLVASTKLNSASPVRNTVKILPCSGVIPAPEAMHSVHQIIRSWERGVQKKNVDDKFPGQKMSDL